eukprot:4672159-Prymnesium_polylepis.1
MFAGSWFVSTLFWISATFALCGHGLLRFATTPARCLAATLLCCAASSHWAWGSDSWGPYHVDQDPAAPLIADFRWLTFPLGGRLFAFLAGVYAAQLVNLLPAGGAVRGWRGHAVLDSVCVCVMLLLLCPPLKQVTGFYAAGTFIVPACMCYLVFAACCTSHGLMLRALASPCFTSFAPASYAAYCLQGTWLAVASSMHRDWDKDDPSTAALFLFALWASAFALEATLGAWANRRTRALLKSLEQPS